MFALSQTDEHLPAYATDLVVGACGLFVGCFALMFETVGIFALGALSGATVSNLVFQFATVTREGVEGTAWLHISVVAAGAALLGVVMILVKHDLKRVLTSFVGSYFFVSGVDYYLYFIGQHLEEPPSFLPCSPRLWPSVFFKSGFECSSALCYVLLGSWALLFLAGVIVQTKLHAAEQSAINVPEPATGPGPPALAGSPSDSP